MLRHLLMLGVAIADPSWQAGPGGTFFVHGDYGDSSYLTKKCRYNEGCQRPFNPDKIYDGRVNCRLTCGAYGAEAVGARSVCNVPYTDGRSNEDCTYETSGGPELDIHCPAWVDRFELHPEGKACANFADIVGMTPDTFPLLWDQVAWHSIQCQCLLPAPPPLPPLLPPPSPSPPLPPPPPIACDKLVDDEGACGQANAGAICRHCCSANDVCGTDDGAGPWCGEGSQLEYSYAKIDPDATECPPPKSVKHHTVTFQPAQCIINPATGKSHCMSLPIGYDINDDSDPTVAHMKRRVFDLDR